MSDYRLCRLLRSKKNNNQGKMVIQEKETKASQIYRADFAPQTPKSALH